MDNIIILQRNVSHYRNSLIKALRESTSAHITVAHDPDYTTHSGPNRINSISPDESELMVTVRYLRLGHLPIAWQKGATALIRRRRPEAVVLLADPWILSNWYLLIRKRLGLGINTRLVLWGHGWNRVDPLFRRIIKRAYYGLADALLVYASRARELGQSQGFDITETYAVHNSVDSLASIEANEEYLRGLRPVTSAAGVRELNIICVTRLIPARETEDLIDALALLRAQGLDARLTLVGDGIERSKLEELAESQFLPVEFLGSVYDSETLRDLYGRADLCVVPGSAGLAILQALGHGLPVIVHGDLDHQGPEVEAVVPGKSGLHYERHSATSLADSILELSDLLRTGQITSDHCFEVVSNCFTAEAQAAAIIEGALGHQ